MTAIELVAAAVTLLSIWLATRENVWYYPTGIVSVLAYGWIYFSARLYAESALQLIWLALLIYGWYAWLYGGANRTELPVTRTPPRMWIVAIVCGVLLSAGIIYIQRTYTNNPNPYVDSSIAAWSIVAQWMTARKWIENWLLWIAVNAVAVPLYLYRELYITAALYAFLLILAIEGWRKWRTSLVSA